MKSNYQKTIINLFLIENLLKLKGTRRIKCEFKKLERSSNISACNRYRFYFDCSSCNS